MLKITLDTNCIDDAALRAAAMAAGAEVATFSVSRKELGNTSFAAHLQGVIILPEQTVWADSVWADGVWADRFWRSAIDVPYKLKDGTAVRGDPFEAVLQVVSNGSLHPKSSSKNLSPAQRRQFRDAMHLALHAQHHRDVFVSSDKKAFIDNGRRATLEQMLATRIMTPTEAIAMLSSKPQSSSLSSLGGSQED